MNNEIKKVKSQKRAATSLIFVPLALIMFKLIKSDFANLGIKDYVLFGSGVALIIVGGVGLRNSLRKEKELQN